MSHTHFFTTEAQRLYEIRRSHRKDIAKICHLFLYLYDYAVRLGSLKSEFHTVSVVKFRFSKKQVRL
jgi:hypothetical protein